MPNLESSQPAGEQTWTLEVVRGASAGRVYSLDGGEVVLGNETRTEVGSKFLSLADQEGASPRKMAPHHVALSRLGASGWFVRDLDSPGGTFVNNRRVLAGALHPLGDGDLIQIGSIQLRLGRANPTPTPVHPASTGFAYQFPSGSTCRTWDDFLALSAQRWEDLRDELISGRLGDFLGSVGHVELIPLRPETKPTTEQADEALDAWLARLPTRSPSKPELDVHPLRMSIEVAAGGVSIRRKVRVANVGHGLLRVVVGVESSELILTLSPDLVGREIIVRDHVDVPFDLAIPDPFPGRFTAQMVISAGVEAKRVLIQVDRISPTVQSGSAVEDQGAGSSPMADPFASIRAMPVGKRVIIGALVAMTTRLVVGVVGGAIGEDAMIASGPDVPRLGAGVVALAVVGFFFGGWLASRRGGRGDAVSGAVSGAGLGVLLASVLVSACRAIEPLLGPMVASPVAVSSLWAVFGGFLAALVASSHPRLVGPTEEPPR